MLYLYSEQNLLWSLKKKQIIGFVEHNAVSMVMHEIFILEFCPLNDNVILKYKV